MAMFAAAGKTGSSNGSVADVAGWLSLAAAPTFWLMAWISAFGSAGMTMSPAAPATMPINDMALMYLLMGLFHLSPWLILIAGRSRRCNTPNTQTEGN